MMNTLEIALSIGLNVEIGIPVTKENLNFISELPKDMDNFIKNITTKFSI